MSNQSWALGFKKVTNWFAGKFLQLSIYCRDFKQKPFCTLICWVVSAVDLSDRSATSLKEVALHLKCILQLCIQQEVVAANWLCVENPAIVKCIIASLFLTCLLEITLHKQLLQSVYLKHISSFRKYNIYGIIHFKWSATT